MRFLLNANSICCSDSVWIIAMTFVLSTASIATIFMFCGSRKASILFRKLFGSSFTTCSFLWLVCDESIIAASSFCSCFVGLLIVFGSGAIVIVGFLVAGGVSGFSGQKLYVQTMSLFCVD